MLGHTGIKVAKHRHCGTQIKEHTNGVSAQKLKHTIQTPRHIVIETHKHGNIEKQAQINQAQ